MSVPEELQGRNGDMLAARVMVPIFLAVVYGLYEFIRWGASSEYELYTYVPVIGGIAAMGGLMTYYLRVVSPSFQKMSWVNTLLLLGFLPYVFLTYVIVFFGLYAIYRGLIASFSIWTIVGGVFWIAVAYRGIYGFWIMTEIVEHWSKTHPPIR